MVVSGAGVSGTVNLSPADAAVFETFVVPRYLALFAEVAMDMLLAGESIRLAHVGCRTGYPDKELAERFPGSHIVGIDANEPAVELARNKATAFKEGELEYRIARTFPTDLETGGYSHSLCLHPTATPSQRVVLFGELARVLYAGGQALVSLPLRGSFQEVGDLFKEYALKHDKGEFGKTVELGMQSQPSIEELSEELEDAGFDDVDVEIRSTQLSFDSGRAFAEDPVTRLLLTPELEVALEETDLAQPLQYVFDAIDRYWSETKFELTLNVGCASARRY